MKLNSIFSSFLFVLTRERNNIKMANLPYRQEKYDIPWFTQ